MDTIYLSGPMRDQPRYNFDAFEAAAKDLRSKGWNVISPHEMDIEVGFNPDNDVPDEEFFNAAMKRDVLAIVEAADAIAMLPGWLRSTGSMAEAWLAKWKHIPIYEYPSMREIPREAIYCSLLV